MSIYSNVIITIIVVLTQNKHVIFDQSTFVTCKALSYMATNYHTYSD